MGPNHVTQNYATIGGGLANTASGVWSAVAGGTENTASGFESTVAGGAFNKASGDHSTVAGGYGNTASGTTSTVAGGLNASAGGDYSFAAGSYANAFNNGCVVFSDNSSFNVTSCFIDNGFVARALGGVYFFTAGTSGTTYTGTQLAPGSSSWTVYSDSAGKDNVRQVDVEDALERVTKIPIATWNWKAQGASIRHMGPMAQDFYAAFGLGETDKGISTVDGQGVALAAIQGLNAKVEDQQREIAELRERVSAAESLRGELAALRSALAELLEERRVTARRN